MALFGMQAAYITSEPVEYLVTSPSGRPWQFDAKDAINNWNILQALRVILNDVLSAEYVEWKPFTFRAYCLVGHYSNEYCWC